MARGWGFDLALPSPRGGHTITPPSHASPPIRPSAPLLPGEFTPPTPILVRHQIPVVTSPHWVTITAGGGYYVVQLSLNDLVTWCCSTRGHKGRVRGGYKHSSLAHKATFSLHSARYHFLQPLPQPKHSRAHNTRLGFKYIFFPGRVDLFKLAILCPVAFPKRFRAALCLEMLFFIKYMIKFCNILLWSYKVSRLILKVFLLAGSLSKFSFQ